MIRGAAAVLVLLGCTGGASNKDDTGTEPVTAETGDTGAPQTTPDTGTPPDGDEDDDGWTAETGDCDDLDPKVYLPPGPLTP